MKKVISIIISAVILLSGCGKADDESSNFLNASTSSDASESSDFSESSNFLKSFREYVTENAISLESSSVAEYDIKELEAFFEKSRMNENMVFENNSLPLNYSEVNMKFPIEIFRENGYSVYKVKQGGYFYVFWVGALDSQSKGEPTVYFSSYISSEKSASDFDSIKIGESTLSDVKKIDPYFELNFLLSCGIFSYSYLDDISILEIEYEASESIDSYDDLVVKEKKVVPRSSVSSRYSSVLTDDIPKK